MSFFSKYHCTFKEIGVCKDVTRQLRQLVSRVNKSSLCNVLVVYCIVFMLCFFLMIVLNGVFYILLIEQ